MAKFQVVLETAIYHTVYVDANDPSEAQDKAFDLLPESVYVPGFEVNEAWFIDSVVNVGDDDE